MGVYPVMGNGNSLHSGSSLDYPQGVQLQITTTNQTINIRNLPSDSYLMVFDASGRNVFKGAVSQSVSIPVRGKGVYIIRAQVGKEILSQKVLVHN